MNSNRHSQEELVQESQDNWNQLGSWWDDQTGESGNDLHRILIAPTTERLLSLKSGEKVLDIACGNGQFSRRLAALGAEVVACDFSESFLERARQHQQSINQNIIYKHIDATKEAQLLSLGQRQFDAAVANMALMDIVTIEPLLNALSQLLKVGGCFVFSILHPCFSSLGSQVMAEQIIEQEALTTLYSVKVTKYLTPSTQKGLATPGQPVSHYYFHRSISHLLNICFAAGFVLDGIEELAWAGQVAPDRLLSWKNITEIPPILVIRLRLL
ncbi:MAG: class I SAM-dependent methyltransferase [Microcoleus sp.]|jgi:2-polyprenyl-3-methyl-5-hydroxy-6-metoxy-1,4-benzoquinol methylase